MLSLQNIWCDLLVIAHFITKSNNNSVLSMRSIHGSLDTKREIFFPPNKKIKIIKSFLIIISKILSSKKKKT